MMVNNNKSHHDRCHNHQWRVSEIKYLHHHHHDDRCHNHHDEDPDDDDDDAVKRWREGMGGAVEECGRN